MAWYVAGTIKNQGEIFSSQLRSQIFSRQNPLSQLETCQHQIQKEEKNVRFRQFSWPAYNKKSQPLRLWIWLISGFNILGQKTNIHLHLHARPTEIKVNTGCSGLESQVCWKIYRRKEWRCWRSFFKNYEVFFLSFFLFGRCKVLMFLTPQILGERRRKLFRTKSQQCLHIKKLNHSRSRINKQDEDMWDNKKLMGIQAIVTNLPPVQMECWYHQYLHNQK